MKMETGKQWLEKWIGGDKRLGTRRLPLFLIYMDDIVYSPNDQCHLHTDRTETPKFLFLGGQALCILDKKIPHKYLKT